MTSVRTAQAKATTAPGKAREANTAHVEAVVKSGDASFEAVTSKAQADAAALEAAKAAADSAAALAEQGAARKAASTLTAVLGTLREALHIEGIPREDADDLLREFTTRITQARNKAAMRSKNTP
jgi:hypothetical protein